MPDFVSLAPLYDGSVSTAKLAAGAVTEAKMTLADNTTNNASATKHGFLPKLSNDATQFLNGVGSFVAGGGWAVIATATLEANAASITFSDIATTYKALWLVGIAKSSYVSGDRFIRIRFNSDGGNNYAWKIVQDNPANAIVNYSASSQSAGCCGIAPTNDFGAINALICKPNAGQRCSVSFGPSGAINQTFSGVTEWTETANKISTVLIFPDADSFVAGTTIYLLGLS